MLSFFKDRKNQRAAADEIYTTIVVQARQPVFYTGMAVPDSVEGRFEMIVLHGFMVWHRLQAAPDGAGRKLAQALFDRMFKDIESSLREMGVGDYSVPHRMKRMMRGFHGRALAYRDAVKAGALGEVLARNLYFSVDERPEEAVLQGLEQYVLESLESLEGQDFEDIKQGKLLFIPAVIPAKVGKLNTKIEG